jgi:AcrR family transcriptional regulator
MTKPGLRERKKQKTRSAIQREALRLFQAQGYDATTVEQIAEAAEISQSTFFRYFPTKEDVVLLDDYDPVIAKMIAERPAEEPPVTAIRKAMADTIGVVFVEDQELVRNRLSFMLSVPAIRARMFEQSSETHQMLCAVFSERTGRDPDSFDIRIAVGAIIGAMNAAVLHWAQDPDTNLEELITRALELVEHGLKLESTS